MVLGGVILCRLFRMVHSMYVVGRARRGHGVPPFLGHRLPRAWPRFFVMADRMFMMLRRLWYDALHFSDSHAGNL